MTWYRFSQKRPPKGVLLNVFRHQKLKYLHAKYYVKDINVKGETQKNVNVWYSQHQNNYPCHDMDAWQELEFYSIENVKVTYDGK